MLLKYTTKELELLARIMRAEALNEGNLGMLMVGNVVVNRAIASCLTFTNVRTLTDVIYQKNQFSGTKIQLQILTHVFCKSQTDLFPLGCPCTDLDHTADIFPCIKYFSSSHIPQQLRRNMADDSVRDSYLFCQLRLRCRHFNDRFNSTAAIKNSNRNS